MKSDEEHTLHDTHINNAASGQLVSSFADGYYMRHNLEIHLHQLQVVCSIENVSIA
jgi:hypothetical protein